MFSLNKAALLAALAIALTSGGVVVGKYNDAIELSNKLTSLK